ncbi:hypothetical protein [Streptomyces virginiae]|uniref:hypothetical protein n=1 Tax=Streptomyces virginiae TaxID=1961 RepID=UPI00333009F4
MSESTVEENQKRARQHVLGCGERAREHQLSHHRWRFFSAILTGLGAVFGALAGGTLLAAAETGTAWSYAAGALGALGAAAIALDAQLGLKAQADAHRRAATGFSTLRTAYYDLAHLTTPTAEEARIKLDDLTARKAELEENSPMTEPWAQEKRAKQRAAENQKEAVREAAS